MSKNVLLAYTTDNYTELYTSTLSDTEFNSAEVANGKFVDYFYSCSEERTELRPFVELLFTRDEDGYPTGIIDIHKWKHIPYGTSLQGSYTVIAFDWAAV